MELLELEIGDRVEGYGAAEGHKGTVHVKSNDGRFRIIWDGLPYRHVLSRRFWHPSYLRPLMVWCGECHSYQTRSDHFITAHKLSKKQELTARKYA